MTARAGHTSAERQQQRQARDACDARAGERITAEAGEARELVLDDGRAVRIRPLRRAEREKYERAVAGLSARSRYLRFAAPLPRISAGLVDQMMQIDGSRHVVHAALTPDQSTVVGVSRYVRIADDPRTAEVAIAIADDWQGHGLGRELFARTIECARLAGVGTLVATTLRENRGAARLATGAGFSAAAGTGIYTDFELILSGS